MVKPLKDMTWEEAKAAIEKTKVALIPTGSIEQHGPHMPLGTDYVIAEKLADMVRERVDCIVTPGVPVGFASYHTDFEGTMSVDPDILTEYYLGMAGSLVDYGITHVLFVNGHGGNGAALTQACRALREEGIPAAYVQWWDLIGGLKDEWAMLGHGDINECSMMLALEPDNVKMDKASIPTNKHLTDEILVLDGSACKFGEGVVRFYLRMGEVSDTGDMLEYGHAANADYSKSPADSTAENGQEILEAAADYIARFVPEFQKIEFDPVG